MAVLDLRQPRVREALDVTLEELTAAWSDHSPNEACLRVAQRAVQLGADGFIVPSAARSDGWCIDILPRGFSMLRQISRRAVVPVSLP